MKFGKWIGLACFIVLLILLWQIRQVLLLIFAAVVFATLINQLVARLQELSIARGWAVAIALLGIAGLITAAIWFVVPALANRLPEFTALSESGLFQLQRWYQQLRGLVPGEALSGTSLGEILPQLTRPSPSWFGRVIAVFAGSVDFFLNLLLVIAITVMLLGNPKSYRRLLLLAFPQFYRPRADEILKKCEIALVGWGLGVLFNMTVIAFFSGLGLALIGVPLPLVNALLAGFLAIIPNIGPVLSVVPPVLMALAIQPWMAIAVIILYIAIQQIESTVLTPLVMKRQVSLLPAVTLAAQVIFSVFFGLLGLFLALPLVVVIQVWSRELLVKDILNRWPPPRRQMRPVRRRRHLSELS